MNTHASITQTDKQGIPGILMNNPSDPSVSKQFPYEKYVLWKFMNTGNLYLLERKRTRYHEIERFLMPSKTGYSRPIIANWNLTKIGNSAIRRNIKIVAHGDNVQDVKAAITFELL